MHRHDGQWVSDRRQDATVQWRDGAYLPLIWHQRAARNGGEWWKAARPLAGSDGVSGTLVDESSPWQLRTLISVIRACQPVARKRTYLSISPNSRAWGKTANRHRYWQRPLTLQSAILEAVKAAATKT
jgi:hypothetical protein